MNSDANYNAWIALVNAAQAAGTLPPCPATLPGQPVQTGGTVTHDTPDGKGLVGLIGLPTGNHYIGQRLAIQEIGLSLPAFSAARETCMNAIGAANGRYTIGGAGFIGVAFDSHEVDNKATGGKDCVLTSPAVNIENSVAFPAMTVVSNGVSYDTSTVAGVIQYCLAAKGDVAPNPALSGGGAGDGHAKAQAAARRAEKAAGH